MPQQYSRHCVVGIDNVLPHLLNRKQNRIYIEGKGVSVKGTRLMTFSRGIVCSNCGLTATHFAVERDKVASENTGWHLNLYGNKDGEEVLFTHDHTLARGLGGSAKDPSNLTTMCLPCNATKAVHEGKLAHLQNKRDTP